MSTELTREVLWAAGVQFGHHKQKWNPKMKPYIYGVKRKLYILNLEKTLQKIEEAKAFLQDLSTKKGKILFVGTKNQAKWAIQDAAIRSDNFYVVERWLGGTLTNLKTVNLRVKRLWEITRDIKTGKLNLLPKKEQLKIQKEKTKLEKLFTGIKGMRELPKALFVIDPTHEAIAVAEARKLNIPVIGLCDTNSDPDVLDCMIPANDDFYKSIALITNYLVDYYGEQSGLTFDPPTEKPQELIEQSISKRRPVTMMRPSKKMNYEPVIPLNVNRSSFLKSKVVVNLSNYKALIEEGKKSKTALKAAELISLKPNYKVFKYEDALLKILAENKPVDPSLHKSMAAKTEETPMTKTSVAVDKLNEIKILDNDLNLTLASLLMKDLRDIAKLVGAKTAPTKQALINNLTEKLTIKNDKVAVQGE